MLVALGAGRWDVTHRAVVVGLVEDPEDAGRHLADGADALATVGVELDVDLPVVALDGPELEAVGELVVPAPARDADRDEVLATQALAVVQGKRVVLTRDVRGTRRVVDVLAAILSRT